MEDFVIGVILLVIIGAAVFYIVKAKRKGVKCIGCPSDGECMGKKSADSGCCCGCGCENESHTDEA